MKKYFKNISKKYKIKFNIRIKNFFNELEFHSVCFYLNLF